MTRSSTLTIRTPEGITFSLPLAGPVARMLAWAIDAACIGVASQVLGIVAAGMNLLSAAAATAFTVVGFFVLSIGYAMATEWLWRGQTLGKRLMHLRVIDERGLKLQPSQIVIRNLLRFVDSLPAPYLVGGVACLFSRHAQRLGDFAANTVVVRTTPQPEPDLDQLLAGKFNSFREHGHLAGRLRQRVSPPEAMIGLRALLRREQLEPAARVALFAELARHYRTLVEFPADATVGLTDEQYVRNVVDICFRTTQT